MSRLARRLGAATLGLIVTLPLPALAQQELFDMLKRLEGGQAAPKQQQRRDPAPAKQFTPGQGGAARAAGGPAGLIETVGGKVAVEEMDYVFPGQVIELGGGGSIVLTYFDSCVTETVKGGRVTIGAARSQVSGGQVSSKTMPCQGARPIIAADAGEAGASAKRVTPFLAAEWREQSVKGALPTFKWRFAKGTPATVSLVYLDARPPRLLWRQDTTGAFLAYPRTAPAIEPGMPYLVQVETAQGRVASVFSLDPRLDIADALVNRVVRVGD